MVSVELIFLIGVAVVGKWGSWVAVSVELKLLILVAVFGKWGWFVITICIRGDWNGKWRVECMERNAWRWDEEEQRRDNGCWGKVRVVGPWCLIICVHMILAQRVMSLVLISGGSGGGRRGRGGGGGGGEGG